MAHGGTAPAGWYPDPTRPGTERWWHGAGWSDHSRPLQSLPSPVLSAPPEPPPVPRRGEAGLSTVEPVPRAEPSGFVEAPPFGRPAPRRGPSVGLLTGLLVGLVLVAGGCSVVLAGLLLRGSGESAEVTSPSPPPPLAPAPGGGAAAATPDGDTVTDADGDPGSSGAERGAPGTGSCLVTDDETVTLEFVNTSSAVASFVLTLAFSDDAGQRLADEATFVSYLRPGERTIEEQFVFEQDGDVCEIIGVNRVDAGSESRELGEVNGCEVAAEANVFGDLGAEVSITNGTDETNDYSLQIAFVRPDGVRRGLGTAFVEAVGPGETATGSVFATIPFEEGLRCEAVALTRTPS